MCKPPVWPRCQAAGFKQAPLSQEISLAGEMWWLALEDDRDHALHAHAPAGITIRIRIRRDGSWAFNTNTAIKEAIRVGGIYGGASGLIQS